METGQGCFSRGGESAPYDLEKRDAFCKLRVHNARMNPALFHFAERVRFH